MGKLSDKKCRDAGPLEKAYRLSDGDGLFLRVQPTGGRLWQLRYRRDGKEQTLSIGKYPLVSLLDARKRAFDARQKIVIGESPVVAVVEPDILPQVHVKTLADVAWEWFDVRESGLSKGYAEKIALRLKNLVLPVLGDKPIDTIVALDISSEIKKIEARGTVETAHRTIQIMSSIFKFAFARGYIDASVDVAAVKSTIKKPVARKMPALTAPSDLKVLMSALESYMGGDVVKTALFLVSRTFVRPTEACSARWSEIDFGSKLWTVPASRMKMKRPHIVPLSRQVVDVLSDYKAKYPPKSDFVFPQKHNVNKGITSMSLVMALRRMGFGDEMVTHGFRSSASTNLENLGFPARQIEIQLAHSDKDKIRGTYKRDEHLLLLPERVDMMQKWSDWLESL